MYSLYRPVYLKGRAAAVCPQCAQCQAPIPQKPAPTPPPSPPAEPAPPPAPIDIGEPHDEDDADLHIPVLISRRGVTMVWPHEATRDVLTGKVAYYYADEKGCTLYGPKHIFHALKLNRRDRDKYGEYPVVGGHQRFLPRNEKKRRSNDWTTSRLYRDYGEIYGVSRFGYARSLH